MLCLGNCGLFCSYFKNNVVQLENVLRKDRQDDKNDETASIQANLENSEKGTLRNSELQNPLLVVA